MRLGLRRRVGTTTRGKKNSVRYCYPQKQDVRSTGKARRKKKKKKKEAGLPRRMTLKHWNRMDLCGFESGGSYHSKKTRFNFNLKEKQTDRVLPPPDAMDSRGKERGEHRTANGGHEEQRRFLKRGKGATENKELRKV